jgi:tetratricopeptide (TPR) repeat protein
LTSPRWRLLQDAARYAASLYQLDDAESRARDAVADAQSTGVPAADMHNLYADLVTILVKADRIDEARAVGDTWFAFMEGNRELAAGQIGSALQILASVADAAGDLKTGINLYRQARKLYEQEEDDYRDELATCLQAYGELLAAHERHDDAIPLFRRALKIVETDVGPDMPDVCDLLVALGRSLAACGDAREGKRYLWRGVVMNGYVRGHDAPETGAAALELAELLVEEGEHLEAAPLLHRALAIHETFEGRNGPGVANCLHALATLHVATNEAELALLYARRAVAIIESHPDLTDRVPDLYLMLARVAEAAGRPDDAAAARARGGQKTG